MRYINKIYTYGVDILMDNVQNTRTVPEYIYYNRVFTEIYCSIKRKQNVKWVNVSKRKLKINLGKLYL